MKWINGVKKKKFNMDWYGSFYNNYNLIHSCVEIPLSRWSMPSKMTQKGNNFKCKEERKRKKRNIIHRRSQQLHRLMRKTGLLFPRTLFYLSCELCCSLLSFESLLLFFVIFIFSIWKRGTLTTTINWL